MRKSRSNNNDALDPAKRICFTSQIQAASVLVTSEKKIARVGTSMPATVTKGATTLRAYVA